MNLTWSWRVSSSCRTSESSQARASGEARAGRIRVRIGSVNRCLAILGTPLMCIVPLCAQVGTVHVRVIGPDGSGISQATVSLRDSWGRTLASVYTDRVGEALWERLPLGNWYFFAEVPGFNRVAVGLTICDRDLEHSIALRVAPVPEQDRERTTVESTTAMIEIIPMPFCQALNLSPSPKMATH